MRQINLQPDAVVGDCHSSRRRTGDIFFEAGMARTLEAARLNEYKRLAWRAFRRLGRREEEVGTGCSKEQTRQGKDGKIDALFLHGEGRFVNERQNTDFDFGQGPALFK